MQERQTVGTTYTRELYNERESNSLIGLVSTETIRKKGAFLVGRKTVVRSNNIQESS